jgi:hypothetical protein
MGAIILQGPHHSAQKSTMTGLSALSTSLSKVASVVWLIKSLAMAFSLERLKLLLGSVCKLPVF